MSVCVERLAGIPLAGSFSLIVDLLRDEAVADLGCNEGYYLQFGGPGSQGLDILERNVDLCRQRGLSAQRWDLNQLPLPLPDGRFSVVLMSHVLEHVYAPLPLLAEANRLLRPGGRLLIGLPVEDSLYSRLRVDYYGGDEGHIYSFSPRNLSKLLRVSGFEEARFLCHLPVVGTHAWPRANRLLQRLPLPLRYQAAAAYWCDARKGGAPQENAAFSSYFRA